ncbi:MAG: hypothetical protein K5798_03410 [Nitrosopumilus sp.]|uniref:hypothetical protein n=1 Tax=Nitrosopumilus sp. TaxID=2024843 RepID=UPI00242E8BCE|nr:hypothetical protein [Nitrosopumilus sp.]MCV0366299.1 hypothetical protein [Nitrosopumilus sp.]
MKQKIALIVALFAPLILVFSSIPATEAQQYTDYEHDKSIEKVLVEKRKGNPTYANYIVKICAEESSKKLGKLLIHSDMESITLDFNRSLAKGDCTFAGAVIKNKNIENLGASFLN